MTFSFLKHKNSSNFFNDTRTCTRSEFFTSEFMSICVNFQISVTFYSVSKLKHRNLNSF